MTQVLVSPSLYREKAGLREGRELAKGPDSMWEPGWESRQGTSPPASHPLLDALSVRGASALVRGPRFHPKKGCYEEGVRAPRACRGPHRRRAFPPPASALPRGGPATLRRKHPQTSPSTDSGQAARHCILGYTSLWRTRPSPQGMGGREGFLFVLFFGSECWE